MGFDSFAAICSSHGIAPASATLAALVGALFVAGLSGSVVHCGPMCGPLVIAQTGHDLARVNAAQLCEWRRFQSGLLLPYHLGRLTTYAGLGAIVALFGQNLSSLPWFREIGAGFLLTAAGLFLWQAFASTRPRPVNRLAGLWSRLVGETASRFRGPTVLNGYVFGVLLGFIPCGLVYAALATSAASADPLTGAFGMVAFGLGTVPMLAGIGLLGQVAMTRMKRLATFFRPIVLALDAGLLLFLAAAWVMT